MVRVAFDGKSLIEVTGAKKSTEEILTFGREIEVKERSTGVVVDDRFTYKESHSGPTSWRQYFQHFVIPFFGDFL